MLLWPPIMCTLAPRMDWLLRATGPTVGRTGRSQGSAQTTTKSPLVELQCDHHVELRGDRAIVPPTRPCRIIDMPFKITGARHPAFTCVAGTLQFVEQRRL